MKKIIFIILLCICSAESESQTAGIGANTPDNTAQLDINSNSKGLLIPRMNTVQRNAIVSPAPGLMILNLDDKCIDTWNGSVWTKNCGMQVSYTGAWTAIADFGSTARYGAAGFSIGAKGYVGTGINNTSTAFDDLWEYDTALNAWSQKANCGGGLRYMATGFSTGSKGYIACGLTRVSNTNVYMKDCWEYDPVFNTWTAKANIGGDARQGAFGFSLSGKGYVGGGFNGGPNQSGYLADFWEFDPVLNSWTAKANIGFFGTAYSFCFTIGAGAYVGGGIEGGAGQPTKSFKYYDPVLNTWTNKADYPNAVVNASGLSINNTGYAGLGSSLFGFQYFSDFWSYSPQSNQWSPVQNFIGPARARATAFTIGSKAYIGTGEKQSGSTVYNDMYVFDPAGSASVTENIPAGNNPLNDGGIWTSKADSIYLSAASGNVGIGTSGPVAKLDVAGTIKSTGFRLSTGGNNGNLLKSNASGVGSWTDPSTLSFSPSGSAGGRLTGTYPNPQLLNTPLTPGTYSIFTAESNGLISAAASLNSSLITSLETDPKIGTNLTNTISKWNGSALTASSVTEISGNVGIGLGALTPATKLEVAGTIKATGFQVSTGAGNGYFFIADASGNGSWVNPSALSFTPSGAAGGDLSGTYSNPVLLSSGVTPGTYNKITVNAKGRVTGGSLLTAADINPLETDPSVGVNTLNSLSKWDGAALVTAGVTETSGNIGIGISAAKKLDVSGTGGLRASTSNIGSGIVDWIAGDFGATTGDRVVTGLLSSLATIGAHNNTLTAWSNLVINPVATALVGIGVNPVNKLDVEGNMAIGAGYAGTNAVPANGLLIQGPVGLGTTTPQANLDVSGTVKIGTTGTTINSVVKRTVVLAASSLSPNNSSTFTLACTGSTLTGSVMVSPTSALPQGLVIAYAYVNAADTVDIVIRNVTGVPIPITSSLNLFVTVFN